ncbi:hypothetical protein KW786_02080 [Candidatus Parcubacteria bacterium]|nr:hypothetical protein [Candidatus Parcubacteria bacterium]
MEKDLEEKLIEYGLSSKEARVYLTLLKTGTSLVTDVAKEADINRSTAYVVLESLAKDGLVSITERKNVRLYTPAPPERIALNLENSAKKYSELVNSVKSILPELKSVYSGSGPKPKIQFFEGLEGIKTVYEDTLTSKETIRAFASIESMHAALPGFFPDYYKRRTERNIKIRAIFPDTDQAKERIKNDQQEKRESILVSKDKYSFTPEINIYDHKVVFMSLKERFALVIESEEVADALKKAFELAWLGAKKHE